VTSKRRMQGEGEPVKRPHKSTSKAAENGALFTRRDNQINCPFLIGSLSLGVTPALGSLNIDKSNADSNINPPVVFTHYGNLSAISG